MPTFLQNFTPTPIIQPIPKYGIFTGYFDGCSKFNPGPASVGYYMTHGDNFVFEACWPLGTRTNNQAEFSALLYLLTNAYVNGIRRVKLFGDSKLVVDLVNGKIRTSNANIVDYY
jgi:ribonuclease HI